MMAFDDRPKRTRVWHLAVRLTLFGVLPVLLIALYVRVSYLQTTDWFSELLAFIIPPALLVNLISVLLALTFSERRFNLILPLVALLVAQKPMKETFSLNLEDSTERPDFRVMSFNVASFSPSRMAERRGDTITSGRIYKWLREMDSPDILCLQEFFHGEWDDHDQTLDSIAAAGGYTYYYLNPSYVDEFRGIFGVATFSKSKAIRSGRLGNMTNPVNKATYHDFVFGMDTVRVMNIHLTSMSIRWNRFEELPVWDAMRENVSSILTKLKAGHESRREEMDCVLESVAYSPYPVIVCADLNALPYSETYQKLKMKFANAHEKVGTGMGITYHRFPFHVRIDNQFYDAQLRPLFFKTHKEFKASDHFPIEAGYTFAGRRSVNPSPP